jgi:hypothetical protein
MTEARPFRQLKPFIPRPLKHALSEALKRYGFGRAMRNFARLSIGQTPTRRMLDDLEAGWGNEAYAGRTDYLEEVAKRAVATRGPILECGSGLTTILLGWLAARRGVDTWSLEHMPEWHRRVMVTLERYRVPKGRVCLSPLREYGGFSWYEAPLEQMPHDFQLVICDGPPGAVPGNRYGLLPVMGYRLAPGALIVFDDAGRAAETEVLRRWTSEAGMHVQLCDVGTGTYALVRTR